VVELTRPVTMTAAAYPYRVPTKTCSAETDSPCEIFNRLTFPSEEFAPSADVPAGESCMGCCCKRDEGLWPAAETRN
jgi:hypothetical protein